MMTVFFREPPVEDYEDARRSDTELFGRYHQEMLRRGAYLAPSQFEATFISSAHTSEDIEATCAAVREAFVELARTR